MKNELKTCLRGFLAIFIYLFSSILVSVVLGLYGIDLNSVSDYTYEIINLVYEILLTVLIIYIFRKTIIPDFKKFNKNYIDEYFKYWIILLLLMYSSNYIITYFTPNEIAANQETVVNTFKSFPLVMIILTVLVAPVLEESIFRLSIRKLFPKSNKLYIFTSGFLFGLLHIASETTLYGLLYIIPYSIPGFIFAYTYVKSNNIFVPISLHMIHNGVLVLLQLILL